MDILSAMAERHSTRVYLDKTVARKDIEEIIKYAGMAPSAINLQPWEYVVTYGEEKDRLVRRLKRTHAEKSVRCGPETSTPLPEKFSARSKKASKAMISGIQQAGVDFNRFIEEGSCSFYGAPVAIIVTIDNVFPDIRYLDIGLSVSYLLLAAHAKGLSTCPVGLIRAYAEDIIRSLEIPQNRTVLLGIALGYADETSPLNHFDVRREDLPEILSWYE